MAEKPMIRIDDDFLANEIQRLLATSDMHVSLPAIRLIMKHQEQYLENLGIIKIVYRKDL